MISGDDDDRKLRPFPGPDQRRPNIYQFSPDELRVLRECNRESFFQRCIPLGTLMGLATYYGVHGGFLKPNPRYGATPKVVVAVIMGYFLGKFSYQSKCAEKLMQLPNSQIGEMLRQRRKGVIQESASFGPGMSLAPFSNMNPAETYSDVDTKTNLDLDTSRPELDGLDDSQRPTVDTPIYEEEMPAPQKKTTTYEELRKKNREEYQQKRIPNPRSTTPSSSVLESSPPETEYDTPKFGGPKVKTNKYGDVME